MPWCPESVMNTFLISPLTWVPDKGVPFRDVFVRRRPFDLAFLMCTFSIVVFQDRTTTPSPPLGLAAALPSIVTSRNVKGSPVWLMLLTQESEAKTAARF
jgi:hypothetical protein